MVKNNKFPFKKPHAHLLLCLLTAILLSTCTNARNNFSLKDTVSIFLLNNGTDFFCIPVQYMGDYQIERFEFTGGYVQIGDYEILLKRDEINIYVYLNEEASDDFGSSSGGEFNLVYSEKNGKILTSKMSEPLTIKHDSEWKMNHYCIFIEKHLKNDDMKKINDEYEKGNVHSKVFIGYDITINNELQAGSGMYDDFELSSEPFVDYTALFPNLDFFRAKYLQK